MKFLKSLFLLIFFSSIGFSLDEIQWDEKILLEANTAKDAKYLTEEEKRVILYLNLVRREPQLFERTYLKSFLDTSRFQKKSKWVVSLQKELKNLEPVLLLFPAKDLFEEAEDHAKAMGKAGKLGHNSPSGKNFKNRFKNFVKEYKAVGENCDYGNDKALDIVMSLLIDEGIADMGHRKNILNKNFRFVGISIQPHKKFRHNCVMDFGGEKL